MPKFRRGAAAIEEAAVSKSSGNFSGFVPEIFWKDDGEKKYALVLTPIDETISVELHSFIPLEGTKANGETYTRYEAFISRKDPGIGEDYDKIEDDLGRGSKTRILGVAVELEPVMETVKGRKRPVGFSVKTKDFTRNTDDGEETVDYPLIGIVNQSSKLMWGPLNSVDSEQGPLEELPLAITRHIPGEKSNTYYDFVPFPDVSVDLAPIVEHLAGISYLTDQLEELLPELESIGDDDLKVAQAIARALLDKYIAELADGDRYEELLGDIDELPAPPWGGGSTTKKKATPKKSRPARPTQRKAVATEEKEETSEDAPAEEESKQDRFASLKASLDK
jgi:hypothetical protein